MNLNTSSNSEIESEEVTNSPRPSNKRSSSRQGIKKFQK